MTRSKKNVIKINDIVMYLAVLLKHARLIILLCCFSAVAGMFYYNFSRPVYYSEALINYRVLERSRASIDTDKVFHDSSDGTVQRALVSRQVIERAARRLGVYEDHTDIMKFHLKKVSIRMNVDKNLEILVWAYSYPWAKDFGRLLLEEYLLNREERRLEQSRLIVQTFNKEMIELKARMDEISDAKFSFRDTNELTAILIEMNQLKSVPKEIYITQYQLRTMDDARKTLAEQTDPIAKLSLLASIDSKSDLSVGQVISSQAEMLPPGEKSEKKEGMTVVVVPEMVGSGNKTWQDLDKERRRLEAQIADLSRVYLPGHSKMVALKQQLDSFENSINLELRSALNRFDIQYANLKAKEQALKNKLPAYDEITRKHERYQKEYETFDVGQIAWQKMHADIEKQLEALDYGADKERSYLQFAGSTVEEKPVSPSRVRLVAYSFLLSIALAIAIPFLIEYLDNRVSDVEEVEEVLRIRGLGVVPKVDDPDSSGLLLLGDAKPDYHLQENFRVIRTNLVVNSDAATLPQVILITSAMPREGKTVISSNLAMSFAMKGEKTLLVDCDLRRGRLHRVFGTHNKPGLSDILRDQKTIEEGIRTTPHDNLHLMTCGKHLNSASELLDSASFAKVMEELRQKYQRIIVDTPPVLGLAETSIVQRLVDGVLFVIWGEFTPIRNVKAAIQSLQGNGAKFCGFVLNRLDFHTLGNRYKYFYYAPSYYTNYKAIDVPASYAEK